MTSEIPPPDSRSEKNDVPFFEKRILAGLIILAFLVRVVSAFRVQVVSTDGTRFIDAAKCFYSLDFGKALSFDYHPLYPFLMALFRPLTGSWDAAALLVPLVFSTLTLLPLYLLFRRLFGRSAGFISSACFAFIPPIVRFGADTLSEGPFHFFIVLSLYLGFVAMVNGGWWRALVCGSSATLAYLTRPEGVGVLLGFGLFTGIMILLGSEKRTRLVIALTGLAILGGFLLPAAPYLVHLRVRSGKWELSAKKSLPNFTRSLEEKYEGREEEIHPDEKKMSLFHAVLFMAKRTLRNFYYVPALFALLGLCLPRRIVPTPRREGEILLLVFSAVWLGLCMTLILTHGYMSHRHVMPVTIFLLGYAGRGAAMIAHALDPYLSPRLERWKTLPFPAGMAMVLVFLASVTFLTGLKENFRAYRWDKVYVKDIGAEIGAWRWPGETAFGDLPRVSHYAGLRHLVLPFAVPPLAARDLALSGGAALVVVEEEHLRSWAPALRDALWDEDGPPKGFCLVKEWKKGPRGRHTVRAYRIVPLDGD